MSLSLVFNLLGDPATLSGACTLFAPGGLSAIALDSGHLIFSVHEEGAGSGQHLLMLAQGRAHQVVFHSHFLHSLVYSYDVATKTTT